MRARTIECLSAGRPFGKGVSDPQTDVLQLNDPWASAASSGGKPPLPRTSRIGPMEQQLREQESEITQLRGKGQELAKAQEAFASSTSAVLATAAKAQDKLRGDVATEVGLLRNHIGHELGSIRQELKEEVAGVTEFVRRSLEQQEKRTQTSFEELKELLIQNAVANPRAAKKGRTQSDYLVDSSGGGEVLLFMQDCIWVFCLDLPEGTFRLYSMCGIPSKAMVFSAAMCPRVNSACSDVWYPQHDTYLYLISFACRSSVEELQHDQVSGADTETYRAKGNPRNAEPRERGAH